MAIRYRGTSFLLEPVDPSTVVIPESLSSEQREIARTAREFVTREVRPALEALEAHDWSIARRLIRRAGDLGLLGVEVPEAYGGLALDKVTATVIGQEMAGGAAFSITFSVDTGIGLLPIVYFGTREQKQRYLPSLVTGEKIVAYSLTEPGSGSDALGARTTARLSSDGRTYILNGTKQWTSNAGIADLFVLYAKIDGEHFTAFLVERSAPGVSIGPEENKMGLHGSSTAQVLLNDARVPVENVLHHPGKGHQVAFNTLNIGRFKLGAGCVGSCLRLLDIATRYAQERQQFGRPIASFALIRQKLAAMAARTYALQSMVYRIAGLMEDALGALDPTGDVGDEAARALAEYAVECSIAKVFGSEALSDVVDEAVQIHGGYGYMRGYEVERAYRDSRINRIFEGTNEINRLLIPDQLLRRARRGEIPVMETVRNALSGLQTASPPPDDPTGLGREQWLIDTWRNLFWMIAGLALQKRMATLEEEQEILAILGDLAIQIFALESAVARARRVHGSVAPEVAAVHLDLTRAYAASAVPRVEAWTRQAIDYLTSGDEQRRSTALLQKISALPGVDQISLGRRLADRVLAAGGWPLAEDRTASIV